MISSSLHLIYHLMLAIVIVHVSSSSLSYSSILIGLAVVTRHSALRRQLTAGNCPLVGGWRWQTAHKMAISLSLVIVILHLPICVAHVVLRSKSVQTREQIRRSATSIVPQQLHTGLISPSRFKNDNGGRWCGVWKWRSTLVDLARVGRRLPHGTKPPEAA